jgi:hypothetical protein
MQVIRQSTEVRVTRDKTDHSGTHWNLFAVYPTRLEAYLALDRAKEQGYTMAQIIKSDTVSL